MLKALKIALVLFISLSAKTHAYTVFSLKPIDWNKVEKVDIFVAGHGKELGYQFLYSAITKAQIHDETYPDTQAQLLVWSKEDSKSKDRKALEARGFSIIESNNSKLDVDVLESILGSYKKISSFHIYSHNSAFYGSIVQSGGDWINAKTVDWKAYKKNFTAGSYVIFHGCNTGFIVAPQVSKLLEVPVLGSLSSTDFQEIFSDNQWYHNNEGQAPAATSKLKTNELLFGDSKSCWQGFCHRMMPNNHPYRGSWGRYEVGLPFYKPFCNFDDETKCYKAIASSLKTWATLEGSDFDSKVADFLCPRYGDKDTHARCLDVINGVGQEKFFWGQTLKCSLKGCQYEIKKIRSGLFKKIQIFTGEDYGLKAFIDEKALFEKVRQYYE